jgi:hypothetical protein
MTDRFRRVSHRAPEMLVAAGALVGVAIALEGAVGRAINGVAGLLWVFAAALLFRAIWRCEGWGRLLATILAIDLVLVLAVRPSDLLWAAIGFTVGGALVALVATRERERAALLLAALWLPLHLLVAIVKTVDRAIRDLPATVRTDPPPTAALVPLTMIVAAFAGGWAVRAILSNRSQSASKSAHA